MRAAENPDRAGDIRLELLGPLRLVVDGTPVDVPGPKRRAVLVLLAIAEGRVVSADQLVDELWPSELPESARASLHSHISRLRRHLGTAASRLQGVSGGYRLSLDGDALDAARARRLLHEARDVCEHDPVMAVRLLRQARALWRGPVLPDVQEVPAIAAWTVAQDELRRDIDDVLVATAVDAGHADEVVGIASDAVAADPLREPAVLGLMRALAATGRAADALRAGYEYRGRLVAETGLDPSPELAEVERDIAARAPGPRAGGIPRPGGRLFGRDSELASLQRLLTEEQVVTVVGPGGVGKTRLAVEVARRADDATMLLLAPVTDEAAIPRVLADALDLQIAHGDVLSGCAALLGAGPQLLVVDNCEHVLGGAREVVSSLVQSCPELTVIATSREPLGLPAECIFRLAPLPTPDLHATEGLERTPAVAVFLDRARRVRPTFIPGPDDLRVVADIVRRLDGMPLAIELAAGRLSSFGLGDLHGRLDRALDLLAGPAGGTEARHRTLRATVEWSYELLEPEERHLFRLLSVFPDGVDLETVEAVVADADVTRDPVDVLARLVDASMIEADLDGRPRYEMLETLRSFALDRLVAEGENQQAFERLMSWAVGLSTWIDETVDTPREPEANTALRRELANLRAAWRLLRREGRAEDALEMVAALDEAASWRDLPEVRDWSHELAEDPAIKGHPREATILGIAANAAWMDGRLEHAGSFAERGLRIATDDEGRWRCLSASCLVALSRGRFDDAIGHALASVSTHPHPAFGLAIAALAAAYSGDLKRASDLNQQGAAASTSFTYKAFSEYVAGEIDNAAGRFAQAEHRYGRAVELSRAAGGTFVEGIASLGQLTVQAAGGRIDDALRGYLEVIDYWERTGCWIQQWTTLRNLARLLRTLGDEEPAFFLNLAAAHAPDAPAGPRDDWEIDDPEAASRIRDEAEHCSRARALEVARRSVYSRLGEASLTEWVAKT